MTSPSRGWADKNRDAEGFSRRRWYCLQTQWADGEVDVFQIMWVKHPQITIVIYRWYKPFPDDWSIFVLTTLDSNLMSYIWLCWCWYIRFRFCWCWYIWLRWWCRQTLVQGEARYSCCFPPLETKMVDPIVKNQLQIVFCKRHPIQVDFLVGFMTCTSSELEESKQLLKVRG